MWSDKWLECLGEINRLLKEPGEGPKEEEVKKVLVMDGTRYDLPFHRFGKIDFDTKGFIDNPHAYRLVVLTGGEDISPSIYGHPKHRNCGYTNPARDAKDLFVLQVAYMNHIPVAGICRGAQLLCAFAGGYLIQDVDGHGVWHNLRTSDGRIIYVSSTHHQMMVPPEDAEVLAWAEPSRGTNYFGGTYNGKLSPPEKEVDCVYFPNINGLAMQYHPEYMGDETDGFLYAQELVEKYLKLTPVSRKKQDRFISLPKKEITEGMVEEEYKMYKALNKKEQEEYENKSWKESYMANTIRTLLARGKDVLLATKMAEESWEEMQEAIKASNESKQKEA